jgi:hypothetical protein
MWRRARTYCSSRNSGLVPTSHRAARAPLHRNRR